MCKTILLLVVSMVLFTSAEAIPWLNTNASFGTSPNCTGKGICGTGTAALIPATWTYDPGSNILTITFNTGDLQKFQPDQAPSFQGQSYTFDTQWNAPDYINTGLSIPNPIVIKAGVAYQISVAAPNLSITINLGK